MDSINLLFDFGTISLLKPTYLKIGMYQKIRSKAKLPSIEFKRYVLYYAQENYFSSEKHGFSSFKKINIENLNRLFLEYVRSDEKLISEHSKGQKVENANEAEILLRKYLDTSAGKLGSSLFGIFFQTSISNLWIESLKGKFSEEDAKELKVFSLVFDQIAKTHPEFFEGRSAAIKHLQEFHEYQETFINASKNVSSAIAMVKQAEIWIPTRYLNDIFNDLISIGPVAFDKNQILTIIFKPFGPDFGKTLLDDWKKSRSFVRKHEILEQAFEAAKLRLFAPAITCFLTILDFMVLEIATAIGLKKNYRKTNARMLQDILTYFQRRIINYMYVNDFMPNNDGIPSKGLYVFQIETLLQYIKDTLYDDTDTLIDRRLSFNRHGILHGKLFDYPTEINVKKIILLLDDLILLQGKFSNISSDDSNLEHTNKIFA